MLFASIGFVLLTAASYGLTNVFSPRAAYIHVGGMIGTMMANVFFVIIPNQRTMVDYIAGEKLQTTLGDVVLEVFSQQLLYATVLLIMVSNHFPMTYGHAFNWAILANHLGAIIRHHFNLRSKVITMCGFYQLPA